MKGSARWGSPQPHRARKGNKPNNHKREGRVCTFSMVTTQ